MIMKKKITSYIFIIFNYSASMYCRLKFYAVYNSCGLFGLPHKSRLLLLFQNFMSRSIMIILYANKLLLLFIAISMCVLLDQVFVINNEFRMPWFILKFYYWWNISGANSNVIGLPVLAIVIQLCGINV